MQGTTVSQELEPVKATPPGHPNLSFGRQGFGNSGASCTMKSLCRWSSEAEAAGVGVLIYFRPQPFCCNFCLGDCHQAPRSHGRNRKL